MVIKLHLISRMTFLTNLNLNLEREGRVRTWESKTDKDRNKSRVLLIVINIPQAYSQWLVYRGDEYEFGAEEKRGEEICKHQKKL